MFTGSESLPQYFLYIDVMGFLGLSHVCIPPLSVQGSKAQKVHMNTWICGGAYESIQTVTVSLIQRNEAFIN